MPINIFDVLKMLETRGLIEPTEFTSCYCDCCGKTHRRQWYRDKRTGDEFYVCTPKDVAMVKYQSGNWGQLSETDLINKII